MSETLYRYDFTYDGDEIGGLFHGMNKVLDLLELLEAHNDDIADVDRMFGELEYMLKFPDGIPDTAKFYYTQEGYKKVKGKINDLADILQEYYIEIKLYRVGLGNRKVVYRDEYQVAVEG